MLEWLYLELQPSQEARTGDQCSLKTSRRGQARLQITQLELTFLGLPAIVPKLRLRSESPARRCRSQFWACRGGPRRYSMVQKRRQVGTETRRCQGAKQASAASCRLLWQAWGRMATRYRHNWQTLGRPDLPGNLVRGKACCCRRQRTHSVLSMGGRFRAGSSRRLVRGHATACVLNSCEEGSTVGCGRGGRTELTSILARAVAPRRFF